MNESKAPAKPAKPRVGIPKAPSELAPEASAPEAPALVPFEVNGDCVVTLRSNGGKEKVLRLFPGSSNAWFVYRPWRALDNGSLVQIVEGLHETVANDWEILSVRKVSA